MKKIGEMRNIKKIRNFVKKKEKKRKYIGFLEKKGGERASKKQK